MSVGTVKLKIDGVEVTVPEDTMILKAAKDNGIVIPTLCNLEGLTSYGGCRLCLVEISGSPKLFPACITPVSNGMEVTTNSDKLKEYRKMVVQMLLAETNPHLLCLRSQRPLRTASHGKPAWRRPRHV